MTKRQTGFPEKRRSSCKEEKEEMAYARRRGSYRDSESGKKASDKRKRPHMKMSQGKKLPTGYLDAERDETMLMQIPCLDWT